MPSRPEDVLLVKLPRELADRLRQLGERWQLAYSLGKACPGNPDGKQLALNRIIAVLLERELRHQERSRKPRRVKYRG